MKNSIISQNEHACDNYPFEYVIANIIFHIRGYIPNGEKEGVFKLRVTCHNCVNKKGFLYEYDNAIIPDVESLRKIIESDPQPTLYYSCPKCKAKNYVDARTFLHCEMAER